MDGTKCYIDRLVEQHVNSDLGDIMLLRRADTGTAGEVHFENLIGKALRFEGTYLGEPNEATQHSIRSSIFSPDGHVSDHGRDVALGFYGGQAEHPELLLVHVRCVDPRARTYHTVTWQGAPLRLQEQGMYR